MRRVLLLGVVFAISAIAEQAAGKTPLPGQIVIDPEHPRWLKRHGGKPLFICGPGDPENFLYRGVRKTDGSRDGDQQALLEKLVAHGGNSVYLQMIRSHGGDGAAEHNPFIDSKPERGLDAEILAQWDQWFAYMDAHDILIYLFFYDDSTRVWGRRGSGISQAEADFVRAMVARFCGLRNLIWVVAEEAEEAYTHAESQELARIIQDADPHAHIIGNHHRSSTSFLSWQEGGAISHFAMQFNAAGNEAAHRGSLEALRVSQDRYQVIYAENTAARPDLQHAWACAMGGVMPMLLKMDIADTPAETLRQCRDLQHFFEASDFYTMAPDDELAFAGTRWVLANPGHSYIAYSPEDAGDLGLRQLPTGAWQLSWLDCSTGARASSSLAMSETGDARFARPDGIGAWAAVWLRPASFPGASWPEKAPDEAGFDPVRLRAFTQAIGGDGVIIRDGYLVSSWGVPDRRGDWASAAKPVLSTLLLFAIQEGRVENADAPIRPWVQQALPGRDLLEKDQGISFRHLANMVSGYARAEAPGTHWAYNDYAIALYRTVLGEVLGSSFEEATQHWLEPLQFQDGGVFGSRGGGGVNASPRDLARIGWFWRHAGTWKGKTLLPAKLFQAHCQAQVPADLPRTQAAGEDYLRIGTRGGGSDQTFPGAGVYGFNWWFNVDEWQPALPADAFYALGHVGKEVVLVVPSLELVVAARGEWGGMKLAKSALLMKALQPQERGSDLLAPP